MKHHSSKRYILYLVLSFFLMSTASVALAAEGGDGGKADIQTIASNITGSFKSIGQLLIGTAYIAGIGFAIAGVFKFKQHRDNPTQIPLGTPLALIVVGVVLVFLPSIFGPTGQTIFGSNQTAGGFKGGGAGQLPGAGDSGSGSSGSGS